MFLKFMHFLSKITERFLPASFSFSIILTFVVFLAGIFIEDHSFGIMIDFWGAGLWKLLPFSMQMVLILLFGSVLADAPIVKIGLKNIVKLSKTPTQGIILVTVVATTASWLNWGMGLILGALVGVEVAKKVKGSHYPLLIASSYSGFLVWHGGLSGSIPLKLASSSGFLSSLTGGEKITISETIFSPMNLTLSLLFLISLPLINSLLLPSKENRVELDPANFPEYREQSNSFSFRKYIPNLILSIFFGIYIVRKFTQGGSLNLNMVNTILFCLSLLSHFSLNSFLRSIKNSIESTSGIMVQFPLYGGIMGMMSSSGLTSTLSNLFILFSSVKTFPLMTYLSAGVVNFFVPSGGGQWVVQGPIIVPAAKAIGVPVAKASMALAWGDAWTNMLQPFWALPLLGIAKLSIKDIYPYCVVIALYAGVLSMGILTIF